MIMVLAERIDLDGLRYGVRWATFFSRVFEMEEEIEGNGTVGPSIIRIP